MSRTYGKPKNGTLNQIKSFISNKHTQTKLAARIPTEKPLFKTRDSLLKVFAKKDMA